MENAIDARCASPAAPWILVSGGIHELAGQAKANAALADFLLARGTPVHLVGHEIAQRFVGNVNCSVHHAPRPLNISFFGEFCLRRAGRKVAAAVCAADPAARVLVNGGCCSWADINWVHYVHAAWVPSQRGVPPVARFKEAIAGATFRRQERESIRGARLVVTNSELTRKHTIELLGVDPAKVRTIYCGSESDWRRAEPSERIAARAWLGAPADRPLVCFVGGFGYDERKGFDTLWQAWQELNRQGNWDVDLVAAGGGRTLPLWQRRVREAGRADRVKLIGFTDRIFDLLAAADLLVSPVRYEPYGLNVQEAICRGVPALVSANAGVAEQYPADLADMILPHADDAADLAVRLRRWRDQIQTWPKRFAGLAEAMRRHSWRAMAAEIVSLAENPGYNSPAIAVRGQKEAAV